MDNYLNLLKQYNRATGSNCQDINDPGFNTWLGEYSVALNQYASFLESNGVDFQTEIAEIGKGQFDSLLVRRAPDKVNTNLISESASVLGVEPRRLSVKKNDIKIVGSETIGIDGFDAIMSFNSLRQNLLTQLTSIHNFGYNIIYGAFGEYYDADKRKKLEEVQRIFKNILDGEIKLDYSESDGKYFYYLQSSRLVKKLDKRIF